MLRLPCCVLVFIAFVQLTSASAHMVEFILSNQQIKNSDYDVNNTLWIKQFDKNCLCVFIIPGWRNNAYEDIFEELATKYNNIPNKCFNTVRVNWLDSMNPNYASAAGVVRQVADEVASFIRRLQRLALIQSVELVGFSLGAHIAGLVGRTLSVYLGQTDLVSEIIALDPAGPGFTDFFTSYQHDKLEPTDAKVVITLVTNAGCSGSSQRLGTINFIANNGRDQVGCARHDCICSHRKAVEYFIDSLTSFAFVGTNSQFKTHAVFGRGLNDRTPAGDYNFRTNLVSPFGRA